MTISNTLEELTTQQLSRWSHLIRFAEQLRRERINETSRESVHANNVPGSNHGYSA